MCIVVSLSCELNYLLIYRRSTGTFGLLTQREVHVDLSDDLDRLAVEESRLVYPLFHRFESGRDQQRVAADHLELLNRAILRNDGAEFHGALNARLLGQRRIDRMGLTHQLGLLHAAADLDALRCNRLLLLLGRRRRRRRSGRGNRTDDAAEDAA